MSCAGVIAYALAYVITDFARLPRLVYFPHERRFQLLGPVADPAPSGYVGLWLWAIVAGVLASLATALALRLASRPASPRALGLGAAWALAAVVIGLAYFTWSNWP